MAADTTYPNSVQIRQDGNLAVPTGKSIDIEAGGSLKLAGVAVTTTAAELNAIAGGGLSAAELGVLDGVTPGTVAASKAVVVDANKDAASFRNLRAARNIHAEGAPVSVNTAGAATIAGTTMVAGIYVRDPNGASRTDTFDSAVNLLAALPGAAVGDIIDLLIVNGADAAEAITLAVPASGAFDANQTASSRVIGQNTSKLVRIRITNIGGGTEAYVVYA